MRDDLTAKESGGKWIIEKRTADDRHRGKRARGASRTLASAVEAAQSGDTIKLLQDTKLTEIVTIPASAEITLDLNGKTLTLDASGTRLIKMREILPSMETAVRFPVSTQCVRVD